MTTQDIENGTITQAEEEQLIEDCDTIEQFPGVL